MISSKILSLCKSANWKFIYTLLSECQQPSDCPNRGQNYECTNGMCTCESGFMVKKKDECGGMFLVWLSGSPELSSIFQFFSL